ncbi:MAG: hypothetical protein JWR38_510 [Mucilaginibacter sp.]|nr:hypothetical protein [Mucilaginibacter sp.]
MTKIFKYTWILLLSIPMWSSCKKDSPATYSGKQYLEFYYTNDVKAVTTEYSTYFYKDASIKYDTVLFHVRAVGTVPSKTSYMNFKAFADTLAIPAYPDAVAGTHYVPFDNANLKLLWKMEAGKFEAYVPIITIRNPSLKTSTYQLHFKITASDDFLPGSALHTEGIVYISDRLSQPSNWTASFWLGTYGPVKHQFMIDQSGQRWDADFITAIGTNASLQAYYLFKFSQALKTLNAARLAAGQTELRENPALATSAVTFPPL